MSNKHFNVRVYGLWINEKNQVLVTDEYIFGKYLTKFPGGGLEFGEGIIDCLKREWKEELDIDIEVKKHFYTTDFFQLSVFDSNSQIISIYYLVEPIGNFNINVKEKAFDFEIKDGAQSFRFLDIESSNVEEITLPIDREVMMMLKK